MKNRAIVRTCRGAVRALICSTIAATALDAQTPAKVDFGRDVQPILRDQCLECHGPTQQMRGLRLDRRRDALPNRVGANRARIVPGKSEGSLLYLRVSGNKSGAQMPPAGPLRPEQIGILKTWIDQGAEWPDELSGGSSTTAVHPAVIAMMQALRNGRRGEFERVVRQNPSAIRARGPAGWTPLQYAALYGDAQALRTLLGKGADPNARNDDGGTALMYAVDDPAKVKVLLDGGADPNLRSGEGRTALVIAAGAVGTYRTAKLLIEGGADVAVRMPDGRSALSFAVSPGNEDLLTLLLDRGADKKQPPLNAAAGLGCAGCFDILLKFADAADLTSALTGAVAAGNVAAVQRLLDGGAKATPNLLQFAAAAPTALPTETLKVLISRGADVHAKVSPELTVFELARRQGKPALVQALVEAGAREESAAPVQLRPKPAASIRAAIERSIPALQRADVSFLQKAGCVSCHNNSLTAMAMAEARASGIRVNEQIAKDQLRRIAVFLEENRERALENAGLPGGVDTVSYILLGMSAEAYPSDTITDAWARYLKLRQSPDGSWQILTSVRPPLESSDFQVTAASIRALRKYGPKSQRAHYDDAVRRAVQWLERAQPTSVEDHAFRLLGLAWGGGSREAVRTAAQNLLALQGPDGGWAQVANLAADAYATGQALVALHESRAVGITNAAYQRGVRYLFESQLEDGSWYVRSRSLPLQPHFDSDFPHGRDQFISAAATGWAAMALASVVR